MTTSVLCSGMNKSSKCETAPLNSYLFNDEINNRSTKITSIVSGNDFTIYCEAGYENIFMTGSNDKGQCATKEFDDDGFHQLTFFKDRNIKIRKICTKPLSTCVFWITQSGQVYGNGNNDNYQLGIDSDDENEYVPVLIDALTNVIDIQCNNFYSIALCSNISPNTLMIITNWSRISNTKTPVDVIKIIIQYHNINEIFSCGYSWHGSHGHGDTANIKLWTKIEALTGKHIEKVRTGGFSSYFLDSQGIVWVCGFNREGQLGLGNFESPIKQIMSMDYLIKNDIKIKEIECGEMNVIMMDYNNRIYTFGSNLFGQIGDGKDENVNEPKELIMFRDYQVDEIKSGFHHLYVKCNGDRYYLWGWNYYHQVSSDSGNVRSPQLLDLQEMKIHGVFLGGATTKFIVS